MTDSSKRILRVIGGGIIIAALFIGLVVLFSKYYVN